MPQFIRQIMTGNLRGSAKTILEANILGQSCARVCPTSVLCEGACVLNAEGKKPVWMVLQISWSGVLKPGKTLRFPTFSEERFMTYEAIINGARGLIYFGGNNEKAMIDADKALGWNWTFWKRVLRPVIEEIGTKSPLYPALVAPESKLPIQVTRNAGIEFCAREVGDDLFLLACKKEGADLEVEFSGLPASAARGEVLYEGPRTVEAKNGKFRDWFAPFTVHVYHFPKP